MKYREVLGAGRPPLPLFDDIERVLEDIRLFPGAVEEIYRSAMALEEEELDRLRFALLRVQIFSDIHRNEDMEQAQKIKYVSLVLEKIIFGSLMMEPEQMLGSMHDE